MRIARPITLTVKDRTTLEQQARARALPARVVERSRIVLLAADGKQDVEIADQLGISAKKAGRWRQRFLDVGLSAIGQDAPRSGRLEAIVGLYLNPPEHALVLSVDEKSQIQALDRTQPGLPMKRGRGETMTHDYKRNGTATLFAALNTSNGEVFGLCMERHRHQEWLRFLRLIDQATPPEKQLHLICDNYATHKHPKVQRWLARHKRFHVHC